MGGPPRHVAIVMDGNGRWGTARGMPRAAGHRQGAAAVRRTVEAAVERGLETLTLLHAFSADNWRRPRTETMGLMALFDEYLRLEVDRCVAHGIRLSVIGQRDRLPPSLRRQVQSAEDATAEGRGLHLHSGNRLLGAGRDLVRGRTPHRRRPAIARGVRGTRTAAAITADIAGRFPDVNILMVPVASSDSAISCSGSPPAQNCAFSMSRGPTSRRHTWPTPSTRSQQGTTVWGDQ